MNAVQTQLPMRAARLCRLLDVHCVRYLAERDEDAALALARMGWGFDISSADARHMRELRVLPSTVEKYLANAKTLDCEWETVAEEILKGAPVKEIMGIKFLDGTTVQEILNCSSTHVMDLLAALQLKAVRGTKHSTGPNGSPKITVESFLNFLRKRKV